MADAIKATGAILLTGATGFLGTELAAGLIRRPGTEKIYALVRAADQTEAAHRLRAAWHHEQALLEAVGDRIIPLAGDFTKPGLDLDARMEQESKDRVSLVIHAGAEIRFQKDKQAPCPAFARTDRSSCPLSASRTATSWRPTWIT